MAIRYGGGTVRGDLRFAVVAQLKTLFLDSTAMAHDGVTRRIMALNMLRLYVLTHSPVELSK
jgi:hypothetical protein